MNQEPFNPEPIVRQQLINQNIFSEELCHQLTQQYRNSRREIFSYKISNDIRDIAERLGTTSPLSQYRLPSDISISPGSRRPSTRTANIDLAPLVDNARTSIPDIAPSLTHSNSPQESNGSSGWSSNFSNMRSISRTDRRPRPAGISSIINEYNNMQNNTTNEPRSPLRRYRINTRINIRNNEINHINEDNEDNEDDDIFLPRRALQRTPQPQPTIPLLDMGRTFIEDRTLDIPMVLTDRAIRDLTVLSYSELITQNGISLEDLQEQNCSICLDNLLDEFQRYIILLCYHIYHKNCILHHLRSYDHRCPQCRRSSGERTPRY